MIIPQDIIYFYYMYINLSTGDTLLQIFVKLFFMYIYIYIYIIFRSVKRLNKVTKSIYEFIINNNNKFIY